VGKSTIVAELARRYPQVVPIVTATTRPQRNGEIDKVHYHFLSPGEFQGLRDSGGLLEHAVVHGNAYGTPVDQVRGILAAGRDAILTIDPQGARTVHERLPDALLIFVMPPSIEDLARRLETRGSEDPASLAVRRRNAEIEMAASGDYDYVIVNETDHPDAAAERIWEIIQAEARREPPRRVLI
jgi:guanylate kinase